MNILILLGKGKGAREEGSKIGDLLLKQEYRRLLPSKKLADATKMFPVGVVVWELL